MSGIVIIGNGISGITCARHIRKKSEVPITIISSESKHFYARTALMYIYMGHMKYEHTKPYEDAFWKKNKFTLIHDHVEKVDTKNKMILCKEGGSLAYNQLIIATGSTSNIPDLQGIHLKGVQCLYGLADLELMEANTKNIQQAVVVGGGLIGIEMAEMLLSRNIGVTMMIREKFYWGGVLPTEESEVIGRHIKEHDITLLTEEGLKEIVGDANDKVIGVVTNSGKTVRCDFVGVAIGVRPNMDLLKGSDIETERGVLVNEYFETNVADVYAIGDCVQYRNPPKGRKAVEQVWYTGKIHGETLSQTLLGKRLAYDPGPWFNSAKFLDIEYQTYGDVSSTTKEEHFSFCWQHSKEHVLFRVTFEAKSKAVIGVNVLGIRMRHQLMNNWISNRKPIDYVLTHLPDANFDPEFYRKYEPEILQKYNIEFSQQLQPKKKSWARIFNS